jgi:transcriptional regulator with XRE-family HTH domain
MKTETPLLTNQLRQAILASGETSSDICRATKLDPATMSRFLSGERGLSMQALDAIAQHLRLVLVQDQRFGEPRRGKSK